jgi:hypothetical protein
MELRNVNSSNISQIGFDNSTNTLRVSFTTGAVYDFYDVDEQIYRHLLQAPSKGRFFHRYIKNRYNFEVVE